MGTEMITYVSGDIFESPAQVLVNPVNTVGVMGKGLAFEFKNFYPKMFQLYQYFCEHQQLTIGQLWLYKTPQKWILNFPTKRHWRDKSKPEYIEVGLQKFVETYVNKGIESISFPMLGCGYGELNWKSQAHPLMKKYLAPLSIEVYVHIYEKNELVPKPHKPSMGKPEALTFTEFWNDLISITQSKRVFETLDASEKFEVCLDEKQNSIYFVIQGKNSIFIPKEDKGWLDFWQYLQEAKYCPVEKFPVGLEVYAPYVTSFLSELGYIRPVRLSRHDYDEQSQIGLQIVYISAVPKKPTVEGAFSSFDTYDEIPF
ncbi:MAG: macro domain-containing protein [Chloroflexi bacterium]|nr:macro domain-containing protein [Chloroflexota bacterium]